MLCDPDTRMPRVVSRTAGEPTTRLAAMMSDARNGSDGPLPDWLRSLGGREPQIEVLERDVPDHWLLDRTHAWAHATNTRLKKLGTHLIIPAKLRKVDTAVIEDVERIIAKDVAAARAAKAKAS